MTATFATVLRPIALLAAMATVLASAQTTPPPPQTSPSDGPPPLGTSAQRATLAKAAALSDKFDRIDVLGKLLPVALTKEQIRKLLPVLEKRRAKELEILLLDAGLLIEMDAEVTKAIEDGTGKGDVPSVELQNKIRKVTGAIAIRRQVATVEMIDSLYDAMTRILDAGQLKVMANTLKPELISPGVKVDTDESKIKFFIRYIFLSDMTYDLLVKMSKPA